MLTSETFSPPSFYKVLQYLLVWHPSLRKFLSALSRKRCQICQELGIRNVLESVLEKFSSISSSANSHLGEVSGKQEHSYNTKTGEVRSFPVPVLTLAIWLSFLQSCYGSTRAFRYNTKFLELVHRPDVLFPTPLKTIKNGTLFSVSLVRSFMLLKTSENFLL